MRLIRNEEGGGGFLIHRNEFSFFGGGGRELMYTPIIQELRMTTYQRMSKVKEKLTPEKRGFRGADIDMSEPRKEKQVEYHHALWRHSKGLFILE